MRIGRIWVVRVLLLAIVVVPITGCTNTSSASTPMADLPESSIVEGAYAYPTEAMEPGTALDEARYIAIQRAIGECMADRGFEYTYKKYEYMAPRQYGVADPEVAAVWGFRRPKSFGDERDDRRAHPPQNPSQTPQEQAWSEALLGSGDDNIAVTDDSGRIITRYDADGCSAQGRLAINPDYFDQRVLHQVLLDIHGRAFREVKQSSEFQDSFVEWKQCYSDAGFGPIETLDEYSYGGLAPKYLESETITQHEIDAAVASATCLHETGFLRTWSGMLALAEQRLLEENPGVLTEYLEIQQNVREDLGV